MEDGADAALHEFKKEHLMTNSRDFQDLDQIRQFGAASQSRKQRAPSATPSFSGLAALGRYASASNTPPEPAYHGTANHVEASASLVEEDIDAMA
jgi:hypothetical protein